MLLNHHHPWQEASGLILEDLLQNFNGNATTILENLALLRSRYAADPDSDTLLAAMETAATHLEYQSRCLQDWITPPSGEEESSDLNQILKQALALVQALSRQRLTFIQELEADLPTLPCDRRLLAQIVFLLCLRASQDMPGGGIIRLRTSFVNSCQAQGQELPDAPSGYVCLALKDEAPGYPLELRNAIQRALRDLDYELPEATESLYHLSTLRLLVHRCRGVLRIESQVGRGNTITVHLPALSLESVSQDFDHEAQPVYPLLLLIETEPLIQSLGRQMLESGGFRVKIADQGRRALLQLRQNLDRVNLVILDTALPDMDCHEMLKQIRHLNPSLRILLTSGHVTASSFQEWITQPGIDFIQKPFRVKELLAKVRTLFEEEPLQV